MMYHTTCSEEGKFKRKFCISGGVGRACPASRPRSGEARKRHPRCVGASNPRCRYLPRPLVG
jgi:hypothetical protein